ncbi:insulinase family protein [bacterium]|nr:insulinase family protein [bacterium]
METHQLSNGLTVYTVENHVIPLATLDMWVRVGSKDEPTEHAGISHFLEHMLFKGTDRLAVGEYDRRIEELGGYLNAATSTDYTHYYITLPSESLEKAMEDMADVVRNSKIDPREVDRERLVILEEIRMKQDNPLAFLYDEIVRSIYATGPYANTVIGSHESVSAMKQETILSHYHRFYSPQNMALVVVGDIDTQRIVVRLEELLGDLERPVDPWRGAAPKTEYAESPGRTWDRDWQQHYFFLAYPGVACDSIETLAKLEIAETLLLGGRSSRLVNAIQEKKRLVTSISGFIHPTRHPGMVGIYGTCEPQNLDAVREAIDDEIRKLRNDGPTDREMRRAMRQIINSHLYSTETNTGKAQTIGYSYALFDDPCLLDRFPDAVGRVVEEDVAEVLDLLAPEKASQFVARPARAAAR